MDEVELNEAVVDDSVFVEPLLGARPWLSAHTFEQGVELMLGDKAVNVPKRDEEGEFAVSLMGRRRARRRQ